MYLQALQLSQVVLDREIEIESRLKTYFAFILSP
jgi:hypothetical protein